MNPFNVDQKITYRAINPDNVQQENPINVEVNSKDKVFTLNNVPIDAQQMAEFGMMCFALAAQMGINDLDSCLELLDGFGIPVPQQELLELAVVPDQTV